MSLKNRIKELENRIVDDTTGQTRAVFMTTASARLGADPPCPLLWAGSIWNMRATDRRMNQTAI